jgi:hypothetical protein
MLRDGGYTDEEKQDADDVGPEPQDSALMLFTWF